MTSHFCVGHLGRVYTPGSLVALLTHHLTVLVPPVLISEVDRDGLGAVHLDMNHRVEDVDPDLGRGVVVAGVENMPIVDGEALLPETLPHGEGVWVEGEPDATELQQRVVFIERAALGDVEEDGSWARSTRR